LKQTIIKSSSNLILKPEKSEVKEQRSIQLASLTQIFFARLFDLIFVGLFQFLLVYFVQVDLDN
jgi:hypothetical protein